MTSRSSGGVTESFTYDAGAYGKGRLTGITDATGSTSYTYNPDGQLAQQVSTILGAAYTTSYAYNAAGQLTGMSYPSGLSLTYQYDTTGRLSRVASNLAAWPTLADGFLYQPATRRVAQCVGDAADGQATGFKLFRLALSAAAFSATPAVVCTTSAVVTWPLSLASFSAFSVASPMGALTPL